MSDDINNNPWGPQMQEKHMKLFSIWSISSATFLVLGFLFAFNVLDWQYFHTILGGVCFAATVGCLCMHFRKKKPMEIIESIATLSGIGLTFIGFILALLGLNLEGTADISDSLLNILDGIYPAFFSSVAGVFVALTTHWAPSFWQMDMNDVIPIEDMDIDSQMLAQLKEMNTNQKDLKQSFEQFAEKMVENNMNALREVIADFNNKLQEQVGENFKKLNEAVFALLEWQENYKDTVEASQQELKAIRGDLDSSRQALETSANVINEMGENAKSFQDVAAKLGVILEGLDENVEKSKDIAGALTQFSEKLGGVPESIQENMDEITKKHLENLAKTTQRTLEDLGQKLKGISEALVDDYEPLQEALRKFTQEQTKK